MGENEKAEPEEEREKSPQSRSLWRKISAKAAKEEAAT
jgi:hypothetical protein